MKLLITLAFILPVLTSQAQKWSVRGSFNAVRSYCGVNITAMETSEGRTSVEGKYTVPRKLLGPKRREVPDFGFFYDFSLVRAIGQKQSLIVGYRNMNPMVFSTVTYRINRTYDDVTFESLGAGYSESKNMPTLRLNYSYAVLQKNKLNASSLSVFGGLLLHFRGKEAGFSNGQWGGQWGYVDSAGNTIFAASIIAENTRFRRPASPIIPYLHLGIDGGLRLGSRFKLGMELAGSVGYTPLYIQEVKAVTTDSKLTYKITLKPYFFMGGIYLQYRIK